MGKSEYNDLINYLLFVANKVFPTGKEQKGFGKLMLELQKDFPAEEQDMELVKQFVGAIHDGLAHGNWPQG